MVIAYPSSEVSWKVVILVYAIVSICCLYVGGLYYGTKEPLSLCF